MELVYASRKLEEQCTRLSKAKRLFGGDAQLAQGLLSRVNALQQAETLKDIVVQPQFHFHKLADKGRRKLEGHYAIDVRTRKSPWRLILQPLDEDKEPYVGQGIDEIVDIVRIVGITEVSKHYGD